MSRESTYERRFTATIAGSRRTFTFTTRDGLLSKDEIRPAVRTLLAHVTPEQDDDVLVVDANYGVAGVVLAHATDGAVLMTETSVRAAETCRANAARNDAENAAVELVADVRSVREGFDVAVLVPKPYDPTSVVKDRLAGAVSRLTPDGEVYVAGTKNAGIERYADALSELTVESKRVATEEGVRVYRGAGRTGENPPKYVSEYEFRTTVGDYTCRFLTVPGLFSWESLDEGTEALLRAVSVEDGQRVLDCCCGYGAIGSFIGARTDCTLWATDDDVVATTYARKNFDRNGVTAERVTTGDCLDAVEGETFDVILANPPTHAGDGVTRKLFEQVRNALASDGAFYLVANQIMNYDDRLTREFDFDATVVASEGTFDVIRASRPA